MKDLTQMLHGWHDTKSIAIANDICEGLWKEMEELENESELNWIDLDYKGTIYSKKNSKQIVRVGRKMFLVSNPNAKNCEQSMSAEFALQVIKEKWKPEGKYSVSMYFWRENNVRRDLDNMTTSVLDALVKGGALEDDNINSVHELHSYDMGVDKENVGVRVHIEGITDGKK